MNATEDQLQIFTKDLLDACAYSDVIYYHVPNESKAPVQWRKKQKAKGVLPGVPDWVFHGVGREDARPYTAYLELKTDAKGKQSKAQKDFENRCKEIEIPYEIARTPEQIKAFLLRHKLIFAREEGKWKQLQSSSERCLPESLSG
jgi:hypothetical protein